MIRALVLSGALLAGCATTPVPLGDQSPQGDWLLVRIDGQRADGEGGIHFDAPGGGISNRPDDEERENQERLPPRGQEKARD